MSIDCLETHPEQYDPPLGDGRAVFRSGDNTWAGLRDDIRFRVGRFGRLDHTLDGEEYCFQHMPVGMATGERG